MRLRCLAMIEGVRLRRLAMIEGVRLRCLAMIEGVRLRCLAMIEGVRLRRHRKTAREAAPSWDDSEGGYAASG